MASEAAAGFLVLPDTNQMTLVFSAAENMDDLVAGCLLLRPTLSEARIPTTGGPALLSPMERPSTSTL